MGAAGGSHRDTALAITGGACSPREGLANDSDADRLDDDGVKPVESEPRRREVKEDDNEDDDDDDDDIMADLADVDVPIPIHDAMGGDDEDEDDSDSDDDNQSALPNTAITAGLPSLANGWDDHAVASCFDRAIRTHSMTAEELAGEANASGWEAGPNVVPRKANQLPCPIPKVEVVTTSISDNFGMEKEDTSSSPEEEDTKKEPWRPRPVPLPVWAVDPVYAAAKLHSTSDGNTTTLEGRSK